MRALVLIALVLAAATPAHAGKRRALATAASIVPGALLHGSGHYVAGDRRTARRLAIAEGLGLALVVLGQLPNRFSGGAPETANPGLLFVIPGGALFLTSWFADVYGAAGGERLGGRARRAPPRVELESGAMFLVDPQTATSGGATFGASAWHRNGRVSVSSWVADGAWEISGSLAARLVGGVPGRPGGDGSHLELVLGVGEERFHADGYRITSLEVLARGRWDLANLARSMSGSFAGLETGLSHDTIRYRSGGDDADGQTLVAARLGFGVYVGRDAEIEMFYDHRRDRLAGSILTRSGANGVLGHVGVRAEAYRGRWGIGASVEAGSAWVTRLSVKARLGEGPR